MTDKVFQVIDAVGDAYCVTRAGAEYESIFRKHVAWWKSYVRTAEYRKKVPVYRHPVFPVRIDIASLEH